MAKASINIPYNQIEEVVRKELKSLKLKNSRLETKISKLKQEIDKNKSLVEKAKLIIESVKSAGDLHEWEQWEGY
jgi:cell division protein FtsB